MWTFETQIASKFDGREIWYLSGARFETKAEAIEAALEWARITLRNGAGVAVRVVRAGA